MSLELATIISMFIVVGCLVLLTFVLFIKVINDL